MRELRHFTEGNLDLIFLEAEVVGRKLQHLFEQARGVGVYRAAAVLSLAFQLGLQFRCDVHSKRHGVVSRLTTLL